jgi:hypothetical protein
MYDRFI